MWQVSLKPESKSTIIQRLIDLLPDRWTTTWQCVRHRFNRDYDLPTIEPRRRRRFELHRIKVQRRFGGGDTGSLHQNGVQSLFSLLKGQSLLPERSFRLPISIRSQRPCNRRAYPGFSGALRLRPFLPLEPGSNRRGANSIAFSGLGHRTALRPGRAARYQSIARSGSRSGACPPYAESLPRLEGIRSAPAITTCSISRSAMRGSGFSPTLRATSYRNGSRASNGPTFLTAAEMEKYHIHFAESEEFGDAYLITKPGTIFFCRTISIIRW